MAPSCLNCSKRKVSTFLGYEYCPFYLREKDYVDLSLYAQECENYVPDYCGDDEDEYRTSATAGDYSPSCPWNAPGMKVSDFI